MQYITCLICNSKFSQITTTHLNKHLITFRDYKRSFPLAKTITRETSLKLQTNIKKLLTEGKTGFKKGVSNNKGKRPWNYGLTKETDMKIARYAIRLSNRTLSESTKRKIALARLKRIYYITCSQCNNIKPKTIRKLCMKCARKNWVKSPNYFNGMRGRKISEDHKMKLWRGWKGSYTKPEIKLHEACPKLTYIGDRKKWIRFKNGQYKNPDFIFENLSIVIEVFGDYWHKREEEEKLIRAYNESGYHCLILWESFVNKMPKKEIRTSVLEQIDAWKGREVNI